jgi:putative dimethyl sulfoxide reductase chaperone
MHLECRIVSIDTNEQAALTASMDDLAAAYNVLSRVLLAPADEALLAELARPDQLQQWPLQRDAHTARGLELVAGSLADREGVESLERDYERLFVGPGPLLAPPYESVHLTNDRLLFDAPTFAVRAVYRTHGLSAPQLNREPDDHLGLELAFLAHLCLGTLDALELGDTRAVHALLHAQRAFLDDHLLRWGSNCLSAVAHHAETAFYRGVAELGLGLLAQSDRPLDPG